MLVKAARRTRIGPSGVHAGVEFRFQREAACRQAELRFGAAQKEVGMRLDPVGERVFQYRRKRRQRRESAKAVRKTQEAHARAGLLLVRQKEAHVAGESVRHTAASNLGSARTTPSRPQTVTASMNQCGLRGCRTSRSNSA